MIAEVARKRGFSLPFPFLQSSIFIFHLPSSLQHNLFPILIQFNQQFNFLFLYSHIHVFSPRKSIKKYNFFSCLTSLSESLVVEHGTGTIGMVRSFVFDVLLFSGFVLLYVLGIEHFLIVHQNMSSIFCFYLDMD